jgi:hypothetical protein
MRASYGGEERVEVLAQTSRLTDHKLRNLIAEHGIGYHHVGILKGTVSPDFRPSVFSSLDYP